MKINIGDWDLKLGIENKYWGLRIKIGDWDKGFGED